MCCVGYHNNYHPILLVYIGQTGALRHGISKALLPLSEAFKEKLIEGVHSDNLEIKYVSITSYYVIIILSFNDDVIPERLVIRDPRAVERKKPGQKKARKKFSWYVHSVQKCCI